MDTQEKNLQGERGAGTFPEVIQGKGSLAKEKQPRKGWRNFPQMSTHKEESMFCGGSELKNAQKVQSGAEHYKRVCPVELSSNPMC